MLLQSPAAAFGRQRRDAVPGRGIYRDRDFRHDSADFRHGPCALDPEPRRFRLCDGCHDRGLCDQYHPGLPLCMGLGARRCRSRDCDCHRARRYDVDRPRLSHPKKAVHPGDPLFKNRGGLGRRFEAGNRPLRAGHVPQSLRLSSTAFPPLTEGSRRLRPTLASHT